LRPWVVVRERYAGMGWMRREAPFFFLQKSSSYAVRSFGSGDGSQVILTN
jgi:hypothetical protein